jgi:gluconolactonase
MRKYTFALLLLPACLVYACGGGDDSTSTEDGGNPDGDGGQLDGTVSTTDGSTFGKDGSVFGKDSGTTGDSGSKDGSTDAKADAADASDGNVFDGNFGFPIPEGGTVVYQFGNGNYQLLDGVQWLPQLNKIVLTDPEFAPGNYYTYAIDAGAPVAPANAALQGQLAVGNANYLDAGWITTIAKNGSVVFTPFDGGATSTLATGFNNVRFDQPNDLVARSDGYIYITDPDYASNLQPGTGIYLIKPDASVTAAIPQSGAKTKYNGIALSPDQKTLYVSLAFPDNQILKYAVAADGTLTAQGSFIPTNGLADGGSDGGTRGGNPDGLAVDDAGNVYVGTVGGVEIYDFNGKYLATIGTPGLTATSLAFGGPDRKTLFIAVNGTAAGQTTNGNGALYRIYLNIPGGPTK